MCGSSATNHSLSYLRRGSSGRAGPSIWSRASQGRASSGKIPAHFRGAGCQWKISFLSRKQPIGMQSLRSKAISTPPCRSCRRTKESAPKAGALPKFNRPQPQCLRQRPWSAQPSGVCWNLRSGSTEASSPPESRARGRRVGARSPGWHP